MRYIYDIQYGMLQVSENEISLRRRSGGTAQLCSCATEGTLLLITAFWDNRNQKDHYCSLWFLFVTWWKELKNELRFSCELKTTIKAKNVMWKVKHVFDKEILSRMNSCGVCSDGAPAMFGSVFRRRWTRKQIMLSPLNVSFIGKR